MRTTPRLSVLALERDLEDLTRRALVFAARRMHHHQIHGPRTAEDYLVLAVARLHAHGRGELELGPLCVEIDRLIELDAERTGGSTVPINLN